LARGGGKSDQFGTRTQGGIQLGGGEFSTEEKGVPIGGEEGLGHASEGKRGAVFLLLRVFGGKVSIITILTKGRLQMKNKMDCRSVGRGGNLLVRKKKTVVREGRAKGYAAIKKRGCS